MLTHLEKPATFLLVFPIEVITDITHTAILAFVLFRCESSLVGSV
jgi:hypothetical protein